MIEFISAIFFLMFLFGAGIFVGWKQRDADKKRDAADNARAIIEHSLQHDPYVFERTLRRIK